MLLLDMQDDFRYNMYIKCRSMLSFIERALSGMVRGVLDVTAVGWTHVIESDNAHSAGKESGCQMKSGAARDGSLVLIPG
jgi:hypothetical protein